MRVSFEDDGGFVIYRISEFDPQYEPVLQACFYQNDGRGYIKRYPRGAPFLDQMMVRYAAHAQQMFDQLGYFAATPWETALAHFCRRIGGSGIHWWLAGSCAACIRGVDLNPHDVDIMFDGHDAERLAELFRDVLIEPVVDTHGWVTKHFGVIFWDARIDVASDPAPLLDEPEPADCGPYAREHLETVRWQGFDIQAPPLGLLLNVNRRRGRQDRVQKIEAFLAEHGNG